MQRVKGISCSSLGALLFIALFVGCTEDQSSLERYSRTQIMMGDVPVTIRLLAPAERQEAAFQAMGAAFQLARNIEGQVSEFEDTSETSALNRSNGQWKPIGAHLADLLRRSHEISELSQGAFDITFASKRPDASYKDVQLSPNGRRARLRQTDVQIGLSGIAKGYIVDQMTALLKSAGWSNFLINAGGDLRAVGHSPEGPWTITLPWPGLDAHCQMTLQDRSLASSSVAERGAHLIDPKRRRPAESRWSQVSVLAPDTATADAFATAAFVAGPHDAGELEAARFYTSEIFIIYFGADGILVPIGLPGLLPEISCRSGNGHSKNIPMPDVPS